MSNEQKIKQWNKADKDGIISIPDYLDPLVNSVGMQLRFHKISGKNEVQTVADIVYKAEEFFNKQNNPYKAACEAINKENPMVVAEHIETLVDYVNLCLKSPHLHEIDKILGRELLTKIQSK